MKKAISTYATKGSLYAFCMLALPSLQLNAADEWEPMAKDDMYIKTDMIVSKNYNVAGDLAYNSTTNFYIRDNGALTIKNGATLDMSEESMRVAIHVGGGSVGTANLTIDAGGTMLIGNSTSTATFVAGTPQFYVNGGTSTIVAKLNVNGALTCTFNTSNANATFGFQATGRWATVSIGSTGVFTSNHQIQLENGAQFTTAGTINVNDVRTDTVASSSSLTIANTTYTGAKMQFVSGSNSTFTTTTRGSYSVYGGTTFQVDNGATVNFNNNSSDSTSYFGGVFLGGTKGASTGIINGTVNYTALNTASNALDIRDASVVTIGKTGSYTTNARTQIYASAAETLGTTLTIDGTLKTDRISYASYNGNIVVNKGATVWTEGVYFVGNSGNTITVNETILDKNGILPTTWRFASADGVTLNVGNGVELGKWGLNSISAIGLITVNLAAEKSGDLLINSFYINESGTGSILFNDFTNNYVKLENFENIICTSTGFSITTTVAEELKTRVIALSASNSDDIVFSDGWSITADGYLYNSHFAIPEPSTYAALFGALALLFVAKRRRS